MRLQTAFTSLALAAVLVGGAAISVAGGQATEPARPAEAVAGVPSTASGPPDAVQDVLVPFVAKHCVACHGPDKRKADLVLHTYKDQASVLKDRKKWEDAVQMIEAGEMPPDPRPKPTPAEVEALVAGVRGLFDRADAGRRDPGRVTMRRLNRAEYGNTLRDLLGIDFDAGQDLPADDVGHGFDNIGDVLTLSPLLLERYLAAAEVVVARAFPAGGNWAPPRRMTADRLQPPAGPGERRDIRQVLPGERVTTPFTTDADGAYVLRLKAYRIEGRWGVPRANLEVDGKVLAVADVTGIGYPNSTFYEGRVTLAKGSHTASVHWPANEETAKSAADERAAAREKFEAEEKARQAAATAAAATRPVGDAAADGANPRRRNNANAADFTREETAGLHVQWTEVARSLGPTAAEKLVMAREPGASPHDAATVALGRFLPRAFRRPVSPNEVERFVKLVDEAVAEGGTWEDGMRLAVQAVLVSPKFLFRAELDDRPDDAEPHPIGDHQLASRLSYFLWGTMPDAELTALADRGELHGGLEAQVGRMLKDPRSRALTDNFATQWLQIRNLKTVAPDAKLFAFDEPLRQAMAQETQLFFDAVVRENRSVLDLIDADFTFLNARLAKHYGIVDTKGNVEGQEAKERGEPIRGTRFVRVQLPPGPRRGGVLTQASLLTATSNPRRTSPVKRGKFVLEQILGTPPPPPPPDVPSLDDAGQVTAAAPLRARMEQHRANPACAGCHARMDPIGFAFEQFDAVGRLRARDGEFDIDASGTLPNGQSFNGAAEFKAVLKARSDVFARCLAEKLLTYALGRGLEYTDRPAVNKIVGGLREGEYRFARLVGEIVRSDPFRMRRGSGQPGKGQRDE